ncbi:hypothetical protein FRC14_006525 [Serendipita sp. 396]|nr:hypothetical protein FRC14_006525 [Serendipita sp. 396]
MSRRRRRSTARELSKPTANTLDWSTSYMASASSSHSTHTLGAVEDSSTCEESADDLVVVHRDDYIPPLGPLVNLTKEASPAATSTRSTSPLASRKITTQTETNVGSVTTANKQGHRRHASPVSQKDSSPNYSLLWMTSSKDYRSDADDGVLTALLLGPIVAASMLYGTITVDVAQDSYYPPGWTIESPLYLPKSHDKIFPRQALINGRRNLVQLSTLCAFVLLTHLFTSNLPAFRAKETASENHGPGWERRMRKGRRSWLFVGYATVVSTTAVAFHVLCDSVNFQIWKDLSYFDVAFISAFYQFSVYVMIRLSHGGFTLGEVGLIGVGSTVLVMEAINLTIAKIWPVTTPYIKTVRYPNPLLIYQLALVSGSLLIGFLLSPLLVLSRHTSKVPAHRLKRPHDRRLKHPTEREVQRRALAVSFYFFAILIIVGLIGFWAQWCLGGRNPWVWAIVWLTEGSNTWSRPALLAYWALLGFFSVGAWSRQLARSKKFQTSNMALHGVSVTSDPSFTVDPPLSPSPSSNGFAHVATDLLDAADKRTPTLSLNARRKTFHALALFMFLPGIILDALENS